MQIESKNLSVALPVLQQMASYHGWWNPKQRPKGRSFTNEEVILLKAIKKYTNWPMTVVAEMMGAKYQTVMGATRKVEPRLINSRIPDYFYELTGMTKGRSGPEGVAKQLRSRSQTLCDEDVAVIRELRKDGYSVTDISECMGINETYTRVLCRGDVRAFLSFDAERVEERVKEIRPKVMTNMLPSGSAAKIQ